MTNATDGPAATLAQRLWLLARASAASSREDAHGYLSAIAILDRAQVRLLFVRSFRPQGTDEACLSNPRLRLQIERDARAFDSLDAAIASAEAARDRWLRRGWVELPTDPAEG